MKKILAAAAVALWATAASANISGSSHDLGPTYGGGSACAYCHMPHNASAVTGAPLWARNMSAATYTYYSSLFGGQPTPSGTPGVGSQLCLSCHDGTIAIAQVIDTSGTGNVNIGGNTAAMPTASNVGINLGNDHPISVTYVAGGIAGLTDSPPTWFNITTPGTTKIECTSCHNAHTAPVATGSYPNRHFMVQYDGDFCLGCHSAK